jgi:hypothetical protein
MFEFYRNNSDKRVINKDLTLLASDDTTTIFGDNSILSPMLRCKDYHGANYLKIAQFDRYYFITNVVWSKGYYYISCDVDVLYTYRDAINNMSVCVTRSESENNTLITDTCLPISKNKEVTIKKFGNNVISNKTEKYVIGVI